MSEITYREIEPRDFETVVALRIEQLREEGATPTCDLTEPLLAYYKKHYRDSTYISWLAEDGDTIVATSGISFVEKPPYYGNESGKIGLVSGMYTLPNYRRQGISKKLLGLVVKDAREYGCGVIHVTASDAGILLYEDFGFQKNDHFLQYVFE